MPPLPPGHPCSTARSVSFRHRPCANSPAWPTPVRALACLFCGIWPRREPALSQRWRLGPVGVELCNLLRFGRRQNLGLEHPVELAHLYSAETARGASGTSPRAWHDLDDVADGLQLRRPCQRRLPRLLPGHGPPGVRGDTECDVPQPLKDRFSGRDHGWRLRPPAEGPWSPLHRPRLRR